MRYLSSDQVIAMHDRLITDFGGESGGGPRGVDYDGVEAAVQAVKNTYYEDVAELATCYAIYIVLGHVFMDGNKRTGAAAMLTFFADNSDATFPREIDVIVAMLEVQERTERGERTDMIVAWLAELLRTPRVAPPRRLSRKKK